MAARKYEFYILSNRALLLCLHLNSRKVERIGDSYMYTKIRVNLKCHNCVYIHVLSYKHTY